MDYSEKMLPDNEINRLNPLKDVFARYTSIAQINDGKKFTHKWKTFPQMWKKSTYLANPLGCGGFPETVPACLLVLASAADYFPAFGLKRRSLSSNRQLSGYMPSSVPTAPAVR